MLNVVVGDGEISVRLLGDPLTIVAEALATTHGMYEALKNRDEDLAMLFLDMLSEHTEDIVKGTFIADEAIDKEKKEFLKRLDGISDDIDNLLNILRGGEEE